MKLTPFRKILIANRGEIALRIMRTARRLGYRVVAVYSSADSDARHVREADEAVLIGEGLPSLSYLCIDKVIAAARTSGADAVHPGYGFLAENAAFAMACRDAGLVFIGPSPEAICAMGDKAAAKEIMLAAGVPCVPGYRSADQSDAALAAAARAIGFPVMIKATAGGGGRGMRLAPDEASFPDLVRHARSEAQGAFGDATLMLERAIADPRHIEIQVLGDRYGHAIHLGERDCSIQRRHQKLIEEAPSPAVSAELRTRMGEVAVKATKAINYEGAGTLEFLVDRGSNFYFIEMNTRLQVEHPVTEMITGLDLVELQLRIARGEDLLRQEDVAFAGHAIEVRLCAEDPTHDFVPQSGRLARWAAPESLRVEHALAPGVKIEPFYDSMIAKLIARGSTRDEARHKLIDGLEHLIAFGVTTNQAFLVSCLRHVEFARGEATTAFIARQRDHLLASCSSGVLPTAVVGALLLYVTARGSRAWRRGRALAAVYPVPMRFAIGQQVYDVEVSRSRDGIYVANFGNEDFQIDVDELLAEFIRFRCRNLAQALRFFRDGDVLFALYGGETLAVRDLSYVPPPRTATGGGDGKLRAALNGRVVAVLVKPGDYVVAGQPIVTLEAMKMEHTHAAPIAGTIEALHVVAGEQVIAGRVVVEIRAGVPAVTTGVIQ